MVGHLIRLTLLAALLAVPAGCERQPPPAEVVVYTALDRQFSEPILRRFTEETGIIVRAAYDTESTKTVGLVERIRAEAARPRCDVFWNNEIMHTLRLKAEGLLAPVQPAEAAHYPAAFRDPAGYWFGFAGRARVLLVNTDQVPTDQMPRSIRDLADPGWRGRTGIAKPLFGTTATHVACLFAALGESEAIALLDAFRQNGVRVVAGNKTCAEMVGRGELAFGLTDTDDAIAEIDAGRPVRMVFPDQEDNGLGTLLLPNTVALVKGAPHPEAGRRLIDYLLSPAVEGQLAAGPSAQIALHPATTQPSRAAAVTAWRWMEVDFVRAAELFPKAAEYVKERFLAP